MKTCRNLIVHQKQEEILFEKPLSDLSVCFSNLVYKLTYSSIGNQNICRGK